MWLRFEGQDDKKLKVKGQRSKVQVKSDMFFPSSDYLPPGEGE
jgi:hypothetical protein